MYEIMVFTFVGSGLHFHKSATNDYKVAVMKLEWALNLEDQIHSVEDLHRYLVLNEYGSPIYYRVLMPGYEGHPHTYLTFTYTPE